MTGRRGRTAGSTSAEEPSGLTRRRLVQALAVGAGAVGAAGLGTGSAAAATVPRSGPFVLHGREFRVVHLGVAPGTLPSPDAVTATNGELVLADGPPGRFSSAAVPGSGGRFVLHSFDLGDGLLLGMGTGSLAEGVFAVVGGTGKHAGAVGSYTAVQSPRDLGGDGTAVFAFTFTGSEA